MNLFFCLQRYRKYLGGKCYLYYFCTPKPYRTFYCMNLPSDFITRTRTLLGEAQFEKLYEALQHDTPVSIRLNRNKCQSVPPESTPVPWCETGYYLNIRPTFTFDPLFHAGSYYVQEASSMFVEQAVRQYVHEPVVMLDLCAAPGGKSTLVRSVLPEGSLLVANEVMRNRSQVLAENLIKWGDEGVIVTNNDPADFTPLEAMFDVILTDVPCSGEGMFRKDPVAIDEWSIDNVTVCWQRQRRILKDIWPCLKPGGLLIYSTCTYNREENEDNVAWIAHELGAEVLPVAVQEAWNITGNLTGEEFPVYRFLPHRTVGEGLFLAVLRKHEDGTMGVSADSAGKRPKKDKKKKGQKAGGQTVVCPKEVRTWVNCPEQYVWTVENNAVIAFPVAHQEVYEAVKSTLKVLHAGITVAGLKGKDCIPDHSLAMSVKRSTDCFPVTNLTYEQAIAYLRKEAVVLDADIPRGYVLVAYQDVPLGFVKNIGNRANNLYPQEWRIRSGYLPENLKMVF